MVNNVIYMVLQNNTWYCGYYVADTDQIKWRSAPDQLIETNIKQTDAVIYACKRYVLNADLVIGQIYRVFYDTSWLIGLYCKKDHFLLPGNSKSVIKINKDIVTDLIEFDTIGPITILTSHAIERVNIDGVHIILGMSK